jgi:DNA-binding PadR family transcriptional regulator
MSNREYLGNFETMVLLALLRLEDDAYGIPILNELEEKSGRSITVGSLYAALDRLERKAYVTSWWGEPTAERGGRAKKYFKITAAGLRELRQTQETFIKLWHGIPALKSGK